jgi:hypothetical protein
VRKEVVVARETAKGEREAGGAAERLRGWLFIEYRTRMGKPR